MYLAICKVYTYVGGLKISIPWFVRLYASACADPEGSNSDVFYEGKEGQIALKADHHRPAIETPLNGVSLAGR